MAGEQKSFHEVFMAQAVRTDRLLKQVAESSFGNSFVVTNPLQAVAKKLADIAPANGSGYTPHQLNQAIKEALPQATPGRIQDVRATSRYINETAVRLTHPSPEASGPGLE